MSRKTLDALEAKVAEFNHLTGRPSRAYEPSDEPYPPANVGYAYTRALSEQDGRNRVAVSVILNPGGGVININGLVGHAGDVLQALRARMVDPGWMALQQFEIPRPFTGSLEVVPAPERETNDLVLNGNMTLASHPNAGSCRALAERLQYNPQRALAQAEWIIGCGGSADLDAIKALL